MKRAVVAVVALVALAGCSGDSEGSQPEDAAPSATESPAEAVDWITACDAISASVSENINDLLPSADDYAAYASDVAELADGADAADARLLREAESAARLAAEVAGDPNSQPGDKLEPEGQVLDSLDALAQKCSEEGSDALN